MLFEALVGSLGPAAIYALLGVGFVTIYKSSHVVNFLQGTFVFVGALVFVSFYQSLHNNFFAALAIAVAFAILIGALFYGTVMRPLGSQGVLVMVIVTLIVGTSIATGLIGIIFGPAPRYFQSPIGFSSISLPAGAFLPITDVVIIGVTVVLIVGWSVFLRRSRFGTAMRAGAEDARLAQYAGVDIRKPATVSWCVGTLSAVLAGIAFGTTVPIEPSMTNLGLYVFPALLIGGMDSVGGVLIGAFVFAFADNLSVTYINGEISDLVSGLLMLLILVVKPYGLFGTPEYRRL